MSKNRKLIVFWVINIQFVILFVLLIFFAPNILSVLGGHLLWGLIGNGATYIGGNVFSAWQRSKYYQPELDQESKLLNNVVKEAGL